MNKLWKFDVNPLSTKKSKVQSESDFMPERASPSGFAAPSHFSISPTCAFAFGGTCFHVE